MRISADVDVRQAIADLRATAGDFPDKAISQALNRTATTVRARAAREIAREMGPPFGINRVRKFIHVEKANKNTLTAFVRAKGRRVLTLIIYPVKQTAVGITAKIAGKTVNIPHAFIPGTAKNFVGPISKRKGQISRHVYMRASRVKNTAGTNLYTDVVYRQGGKRLPIQRLMAPGISSVFIDRTVTRTLQAVVAEHFPTELKKAAVNALRKLTRG